MSDSVQNLELRLEEESGLDLHLNDTSLLNIEIDRSSSMYLKAIHSGTTESWNSQRDLIAKRDNLYVYTDYKTIDGVALPGIKIGDGTSYLIDLPFSASNSVELDEHILDNVRHITNEERIFWNNKVTCFIDSSDQENLVFTKG